MSSPSESIWTKNFICASIANMLLAMAHTSVNTLASSYAAFLGAGAVLVGALTGIFFGVAVAMRPVAGPVTTRMNGKKLMIIVYTLGVIVHIGYAVFDSIGAFLAFRILNGIQYSVIGSLTMKIASDSLPKNKAASGIGAFGISLSVAHAIGPSAGAYLKELGTNLRGDGFGFTLVFLFATVVMAIAVIPCLLLDDPGTPKSIPGSVWYKEIISVPTLAPAAAMMLMIMSYTLFSAYMVPYAASKSIANISIFFTVLAVCLIFSRPISGKLADKHGLLVISLPGVVLFAIPFIMIARGNSLWVMLLAAVVASVTYGAAYPCLQTMCIQSDVPSRSGVTSNTLYLGYDLGAFLGPLLGGIIYAGSGYPTMFMTAAIPCVLSGLIIAVSWPMFKRRRAVIEASEAK